METQVPCPLPPPTQKLGPNPSPPPPAGPGTVEIHLTSLKSKDMSITGTQPGQPGQPVPPDILLMVLATAALQRQGAHPASPQLSSVSTISRQHPRGWGVTRVTWPITYHPVSPHSAAAPCCAGGSSPTCCWLQ